MNGPQLGNIPASRFGNATNEAMYPQHDVRVQIEELSQKIEKVIEINIMLQQKIVQLSEAISEIAKEMRTKNEEISLPEPMEDVSSSHGIPPAPVFNFDEEKEEKHHSSTDAVTQMKLLAEQNMELIGAIREIKNKMGKESTHDKLEKALHKAGAL